MTTPKPWELLTSLWWVVIYGIDLLKKKLYFLQLLKDIFDLDEESTSTHYPWTENVPYQFTTGLKIVKNHFLSGLEQNSWIFFHNRFETRSMFFVTKWQIGLKT